MKFSSLTRCIGAVIVAMTAIADLHGQTRWSSRGPEHFESQVQIAGSRTAEQLITKARKDRENEEWDRCARRIQEILDNHASGALSDQNGRFVGIRDFCNDFIAALPEDGRKAYRSIFDPYAENLYGRGLEQHDTDALKQVYLRYINTSFGTRSLTAAAWMHLERGNLTEATGLALLYLEIAGKDATERLAMHTVIALCARRLEDADRIRSLKSTLTGDDLAQRIRVADQTATLGEILDDVLSSISARSVDAQEARIDTNIFDTHQWNVAVDMFERKERIYSQLDDFGRSGGRTQSYYWNPVIPVLDEGAAYFSTGLSIHGVNLFSGDEKWPVIQGPVNVSQARRNLSVTFPITMDRGQLFTCLETPVRGERQIWNFTPEVSVPHRQLFCVDASTGQITWTHFFWRGRDGAETEFVNSLSMASAPLVIGENVYIAGTRFHTSYHHYLCCFDRSTGSLKWSTFVCTGQMEQNMFGNRVRECIAGSIAEKDGVLFYSTNIGVVASVDARLGTLRHTVEYRQIPIPRQTRFNSAVYERAPAWYDHPPVIVGDWAIVAPMDSQDLLAVHRRTGLSKVIDTRQPGTRHRYVVGEYEGWVIVAGLNITFYDAHNNFQKIMSPDLGRRGRPDEGVQGIPVVIRNHLYVTASHHGTEKVYVLDLGREFKLVDEFELHGDRRVPTLGNLASRNDVVVLAATDPIRGVTRVACFYDKVQVRDELRAAIRKNPTDVILRLRSGELHLQGGDYADALGSFEKAWEICQNNPNVGVDHTERTREALYRLFLSLARQPVVSQNELSLTSVDCFERALGYARHKGQRINILFLLLRASIGNDDWDTFRRHAVAIIARHSDDPYDYQNQFEDSVPELPAYTRYNKAGMVATLLSATFAAKLGRIGDAVTHYQALLRTWPGEFIGQQRTWSHAYERVSGIIETQGRDVYRSYEREAESLFKTAMTSGDVGSLQQLLDLYPNSLRVSDAYLEISRRHLAANEHARAVNTAYEYFWRFGAPSGEVLHILANALDKLDCKTSADQVWSYTREVAATSVITVNGNPSTLGELADARLGKRSTRPRSEIYGVSKFNLNPSLAWQDGTAADLENWAIIQPLGVAPKSMEDHFLAHHRNEVLCRAVSDGAVRWKIAAREAPQDSTLWFDDRLVGIFDGELVCLDPMTGSELWRRSEPEGRLVGIQAGHGRIYSIMEPRSVATRFHLKARSLLDGELVFERSYKGSVQGALAMNARIGVNNRWILVPIQYENLCVVLDAFTGRPAQGIPNGLRTVQPLIPVLTDNGLVVSMGQTGTESPIGLIATDPATGEVKWTRNIGQGRINIRYRDNRTLIYDINHRTSERIAKSRWSLVAVDLSVGTALINHTLAPGVRVRKINRITEDDIFVVNRRTTENFHVAIYVEDVSISGQSPRWSTANFPGALDVLVVPFEEGVLLRVTDRHFKSRSRAYNRSVLYTVDKSGRLIKDFKLDDDVSSFDSNFAIIDGSLVVADGSALKVFK